MIPIPPQAKAIWVAGKVYFILAALAIVFATGVYGGKRWEAGKTQSALRERDNAKNDAAAWKQSSQGWEGAAGAWQKRFKDDEDAQRKRAEQAGRLLAQLEDERQAAEKRAADWKARYTASLKNPDCAKLAELLKDTKCPVFRSY